jgi:uncharacterized damage-inducible protein DinB
VQLAAVYEGWEGYQQSLEHAVSPLSPAQLDWRPAQHLRSLGEVIRHVALGRITWLARMKPPGIEVVTSQIARWQQDGDGERHVDETAVPSDSPEVLSHWLALSWRPIEATLGAWSMDDLFQTYPHRYAGKVYAISRQWTLWRILSHDQHHGGQIAMMLAMQGIPAHELRALGGHIVAPPLAPE